MMKKSGTGKKKIEIEKIRRDDYLHVTFSKRRAGLFKKANEICTLCDAETALIVFSPAGKAFTFGHPSVDTVIDRFLPKETPPADNNVLPSAESHQSASVPSVDTVVDRFLPKETPPADNNVLPSAESHQSASVPELNGQYSELLDQLEAEKKKRVELKKKNKACEEQYWWNAPIETLSLDELEKLRMSMEQLKKSAVDKPANRLMNGSSSGGTPQVDPPPNNQINPPLNQTNASNNLLQDFNFDFGLDFGSL